MLACLLCASTAGARPSASSADDASAPPLHVRASAGGALLVSRDQTGVMGFEGPGVQLDAQLGYASGSWFRPHVGVLSGIFPGGEGGTGGLLAPTLGAGIGSSGRSQRVYVLLEVGPGFTGPRVQPVLRAGLGVDLGVSRSFSLGPQVGYLQVFNAKGPQHSTAARAIYLTLSFGFRPSRTESSEGRRGPIAPRTGARARRRGDRGRREAHVALIGPVSLRVLESDVFRGVRARGQAGELGAPHIELERVHAQHLQLGDGSAPFEGAVSLVRSTASRWNIAADEVRIESSTLQEGRAETQTLLTLDAELVDGVIDVNVGQLSASTLDTVLCTRCEELALLGTEAFDSHFVACGASLRVYGSRVEGGAIDGAVEAVEGVARGVLFGSQDRTELATWGIFLQGNQFCRRTRRLSLSGGIMRCNACDEGLESPGSPCFTGDEPEVFTPVGSARCAALDALQRCEDPPVRQRPRVGNL